MCFSSTHLCVLNSIIINIVQNVTKKNVHLVCCVFFYTRQAEADYYVYRRLSPSSPPPHLLSRPLLPPSDLLTPPPSGDELDHRFKIDLYIFIYAYIKKEWEEEGGSRTWCRGEETIPRHPGPGREGGGRLMQRGRRRGGCGGAGEGR